MNTMIIPIDGMHVISLFIVSNINRYEHCGINKEKTVFYVVSFDNIDVIKFEIEFHWSIFLITTENDLGEYISLSAFL